MSKIVLLSAAIVLLASPAAAQNGGGATAVMMDQSGTNLGTLTLVEMEGSVHITGELTGVPNGEHGFHIHETGTCDATAKFESAGAHYEPGSKKHGKENPEGPHAGDLMNVIADDDGKATVDEHNANVTVAELLDGDGSALVLHADSDDYKTDPSGNSGDRFACGVIEGTP
ncbi:MAG TPA: superoxide dismutase family protein [Devosia sp.]